MEANEVRRGAEWTGARTIWGNPADKCSECGRDVWFNDDFHGGTQWEHVEDLEHDHRAAPTTQVSIKFQGTTR